LGLTLVVGALGAPPAFAAKSRTKASASGKAGKPLRRLYDRKKKPLESGPLMVAGQHASAADYRDLRKACVALLKRFDPATHFFVGTGRDPAPIIAFLQNLGGRDLATNFPASGGLPEFGDSIASWLGASGAEMARYFRALIPSHVPKSGRTVVLVDVTGSGKTPVSFAPEVEKWLAREGSRSKVAMAAFANRLNPMPKGVVTIRTTPFPGVDRYMYYPFEGVISEFDRHKIGKDSLRDLLSRPMYHEYRKAIRRRMKRDRTLDKFLRKL
jgi:hypothetical protein